MTEQYEMTANEKLVYEASKLRDLIEARAIYGPDADLELEIADAYEKFLNAMDEDEYELNLMECALENE